MVFLFCHSIGFFMRVGVHEARGKAFPLQHTETEDTPHKYWKHMVQIVFKIDLGGRLKCLQTKPKSLPGLG